MIVHEKDQGQCKSFPLLFVFFSFLERNSSLQQLVASHFHAGFDTSLLLNVKILINID